ncbi:hypothetical protein FHR34_007990 [Kitasatospora kifunensis]|uniref:Uncharacterized protein n=1 Tax=Kitasatospora kifunensis TaxID=58351 RepID=A0A7W7RBG8_KITKI|nr:hypothetical protein [Kitasatospora kifunensis]
MPESGVGEFVPGAATDRDGDDQTAVTQARQVVRQPGAGDPQSFGQVAGVDRGLAQREQ